MVFYPLGTVVGSDGEDGNGIASIELLSTSGLVKTYRINFTDGDYFDYQVSDGEDGGSTVSVTQVLSSGTKLATITIDGTSTDLYCSSGGSADIVTSWESTLSDTKVPSEKLTKETIDTKISKSNTTGLVKNDGTIDTTSYISTLPTGSTSQAGIVQIVDNLTTDDNTKVLSAKQGKAIKDLIGDAITYINGTGS